MYSTCKPIVFQILSAIILIRVGYAQSDMEDRISYAKGVLNEGLQNNDSVKMAEGYYLLAKRMIDINNLEEAYRLFYLSLKINEKFEDHYKTGRIYMRLAEAELDQGNMKGARQVLNEAIYFFKKHNLQDALLEASMVTGLSYSQFDFNENPYATINPDSALYYFRKREQKALSDKNSMALASARFQIGSVYRYLNDKRAIFYLESAVSIARNDSSLRPAIPYLNGLAEAYIFSGRLSKAKETLAEARNIIEKGPLQTPASVAKHYYTYANYYVATGDWKNAYISRDSASRYLLHLLKSDRAGNISRWRVQLETEKKDLELRLHKQEIENKQSLINQQQLFMGALLLFFVILVFLSYYLYKNYRKQAVLTRKNAVLAQEQNHRVKNNLQVISSMLNLQVDYLNDLKSRKVFSESQTRIDSMVLLHRQLYENDNVEFINIKDLLHDVANSVALTFGSSSVETELNMEVEQLKTDLATSVGLIINELLINSFKYAFHDRPPKVAIRSLQHGARVEIIYQDFGTKDLSGIFSDPDKKGFGLNLVDMILFQINGTLDYRYEAGSVFSFSFLNT